MEFPDDEDIQFYATGFIDYDESLNSFDIFDHCALQLEGSDCSEVKLGIRVCALLDLGDNGRRYFDAIVEGVCFLSLSLSFILLLFFIFIAMLGNRKHHII